MPEFLTVNGSCRIPLDELEWRFTASGGPGGQHANTANTRVEVTFDVANSPSLGPRQRERILAKHGPTIRVVAADERSQFRNRELALDRLRERLVDALRVTRTRKATKPSKAAKERRLDAKRHQSQRKSDRRHRPTHDE
jgi:ribosome-associated protein